MEPQKHGDFGTEGFARAVSAALKPSYIFVRSSCHKIWIRWILKVRSANRWMILDPLCVCVCFSSACISKLLSVPLNAIQTRNKTFEFFALWFIWRFEGLFRFHVLYSYAVLQFMAHSLLLNHPCKYRVTSPWAKFDNLANIIHQKLLPPSNTNCSCYNKVSVDIFCVFNT